MAPKDKITRPSFYEVVFNGKPKVVRAFMKGFVMGTLEDAVVIYSYNSGIFHEGKVEKGSKNDELSLKGNVKNLHISS